MDLWISNHLAWEFFQLLSGQVNTAGMGEIIGIKFEAISFVFDIYQISDALQKRELFEKIILIDQIRMEFRMKEHKQEDNMRKAKENLEKSKQNISK